MKHENFEHKPVLLDEVIEGLSLKPDGFCVDGTFGRGGHSKAILKELGEKGRLFVIDKDLTAIAAAKALAAEDNRVAYWHGALGDLNAFITAFDLKEKVDGFLLDLGVSSPQLDDAARGFSFLKPGPLDMRMNQAQPQKASDWLAAVSETELAFVLKTYGEERYARRIARAICLKRETTPFETTKQLADLVSQVIKTREQKKHPATRVFQAIRIAVNRELDDLTDCLEASLDLLKKGGRLGVITFHSLEDQIVKRFIRKYAHSEAIPKGLPLRESEMNKRLRLIKKVIKPTEEEININPRSRSAKLRIVEKIA